MLDTPIPTLSLYPVGSLRSAVIYLLAIFILFLSLYLLPVPITERLLLPP